MTDILELNVLPNKAKGGPAILAYMEKADAKLFAPREKGWAVGEYVEVQVPKRTPRYMPPLTPDRRLRLKVDPKFGYDEDGHPLMTDAEFAQLLVDIRKWMDEVDAKRELTRAAVEMMTVRRRVWCSNIRLDGYERRSLAKWMLDQPKHISHQPWVHQRYKGYRFERVGDRTTKGIFRADFVWDTGLPVVDEEADSLMLDETGAVVTKQERCQFFTDVWLRALGRLNTRE